MSLILTGGRVIDPVSQTDIVADVVATDGVITAVIPQGSESAGAAPSAPVAEGRTSLPY